MNLRSIFSIGEINNYKINDDWVKSPEQSYGYFGGGELYQSLPSYPTTISTVERIDYSNDTAVALIRSVLTLSRTQLTATSSSDYGYFVAGFEPIPAFGTLHSIIDRIDYSNDSNILLSRTPALSSRRFLGSVNDTTGAYFVGGCSGTLSPGDGSPFFTASEKLLYANDLLTPVSKGSLLNAKAAFASFSSPSYGYFAGGVNSLNSFSVFSLVERIDFSNDTLVQESSTLSAPKGYLAATQTKDFAYTAGGFAFSLFPSPTVNTSITYSNIERFDYANSTQVVAPRGSLSEPRFNLAATGNNSYGYFSNGTTPFSVTVVKMDRIDYSNDTVVASPRGSLNNSSVCSSATSKLVETSTPATPPATSFGYFGGGTGHPAPNTRSTVDRVDFSNDTETSISKGPLSLTRSQLCSVGNNNYGFYVGGGLTTRVDRIDYSNDVAEASVRGPLLNGRSHSSAIGNINFGYIAGGLITPSTASTFVERIEYDNSLTITYPRANLNNSRTYGSATGNTNYGYFIGGSPTSIIERIDYSNDTASPLLRGKTTTSNYISAVGNYNYGWHDGGSSTSLIYRLDYSNDTNDAIVLGQKSATIYGSSGSGNQNAGYFVGGFIPGPNIATGLAEKFSFTNDSVTTSPRRGIVSRYYHASSTTQYGGFVPSPAPTSPALPATSYGYFGGGWPATSTVYRIDYSNDITISRSILSQSRGYLAATGNGSYGYFGGGYTPTPSSTVDKINYSNDTATLLTVGPLSTSTYGLAATGNNNYGYFGGGVAPAQSPTTRATTHRIDYANDTVSPAPAHTNLSIARYYLAAAGNTNFGYFAGGYTTANVSTIDRLDYSNDTLAAIVRGGQLTSTRYGLAAAGNTNFGYFSGGFTTAAVSTVDRLSYANDTVNSSPRGFTTFAVQYHAGTGNGSYGYFGGGTSTLVQRVDYSNDGAYAATRASTSYENTEGVGACSAAANGLVSSGPSPSTAATSFGYIAGGITPGGTTSTISRLEYSADLIQPLSRAILNRSNAYLSATSNSSFGWFAGGQSGSPAVAVSSVDKINYSNDTLALTSVGNLVTRRYYHASSGNSSSGWFTGGFDNVSSPNITLSSTDRITYSSDTVVAVTKGALSSARYALAAAGNASYGWVTGGFTTTVSPNISLSLVDRIDYSNDTYTSLPRNQTGFTVYAHGATGNTGYGWFAGGTVSGSTSTRVFRIDYANDTMIPYIRAPLSVARINLKATGDSSYGWFIGGFTSVALSTVDRIDYSNDSNYASPRGNLLTESYVSATTSAAQGATS